MTTIDTSSLNLYNSAYALTARKPDTQDEATSSSEPKTVKVDMGEAQTAQGSEASSASPTEQLIKQIKQQIEQLKKQLEQQQAQLRAAQNSKLDEQTKGQQVMALQTQIATTSGALQTLQNTLLELMTGGSSSGKVDTTA